MKIKVKLFNNKLIINYFAVLSFVSILLSFVSVVIDIPNNLKLPACLLLLFFLISLFLVMWIHANLLSETPRGKPRGILAQLDLKLRRPMRDVLMIFYVPLYYGTSHTVSDCPCKVPVFPHLPTPKLLLQKWKLAEQHPGTLTLDDSYYLSDRSARWKG